MSPQPPPQNGVPQFVLRSMILIVTVCVGQKPALRMSHLPLPRAELFLGDGGGSSGGGELPNHLACKTQPLFPKSPKRFVLPPEVGLPPAFLRKAPAPWCPTPLFAPCSLFLFSVRHRCACEPSRSVVLGTFCLSSLYFVCAYNRFQN